MSTPSDEPHDDEPRYREQCLRCRRARSACWCGAVSAVDPGVQVVLLQHPREARNPIGTARMAHHGLVGSVLLEGVFFEENESFRALLDDPTHQVAVLYPGENGRSPAELTASGLPLRIIAIDGTWSQARSVWNKNPSLRKLPTVRLSPTRPSRYRIRREPADHCLSTIEAIAELLHTLAGERFDPQAFLRPFEAMVEHQLGYIDATGGGPGAGRHSAHRPRPRKTRPAPEELTVFGRNLVLVQGESNGWPASRDDVPRVAMAQWLALRPDTGESFHAFVQPPTGLAPQGLERLEVDEATFAQALAPEEFLRRWRDFVEPQDVLCSWAFFPLRLLRDAGAEVGPYVNLQQLCNERLFQRVGKVEAAEALLALPVIAPRFPGRGGIRLAHMEGIVEKLRRGGELAPRPKRKR